MPRRATRVIRGADCLGGILDIAHIVRYQSECRRLYFSAAARPRSSTLPAPTYYYP